MKKRAGRKTLMKKGNRGQDEERQETVEDRRK